MPQGHSRKLMFDQYAGQPVPYLARMHLVVKLGKFSQRVGGNQPDLSCTRVGDADELHVRFDIARRNDSHLLPTRGNSLLRDSLRLVETPQVAHESLIENKLELGNNGFGFGLAARRAHLQILCGDAVIALLRRFKKADNRAGGRASPQRISRIIGLAWRSRGRQYLSQRILGSQRQACREAQKRDRNLPEERSHELLLRPGTAQARRGNTFWAENEELIVAERAAQKTQLGGARRSLGISAALGPIHVRARAEENFSRLHQRFRKRGMRMNAQRNIARQGRHFNCEYTFRECDPLLQDEPA